MPAAGHRGVVTRRRRRSARSCCSGRPPRPSPAGCSASTRSTSPTSRAPRPRPASCSTPASAPATTRPFTDGAVEVRALGGDWLGDATDRRRGASTRCSRQLDREHGYVAVMAYLDRRGRRRPRARRPRPVRPHRPARPPSAGARASCTRPASTTRAARRPASTCRSPRRPREDLAVPGRDFTFGEFIAAQAGGDATVLADHGRPVLRLHLTDHDAGLAQVRGGARPEAAGEPGARRARAPTRCATPATSASPASPGRAAWCSSGSPATSPARS